MLAPLFRLFLPAKNSGGMAVRRRISHLSEIEAVE
jgi:hypothetical protein